MASASERPAGPSTRSLVIAMVGWAGLAACLTMVFLSMRAVMDVGGSCSEGGPYVIAQSCPGGSTAALLLGVFGGLGFGFLATVGGSALGGVWAATPVLAWAALFGSLGWNFMQYGVFAPTDGEIAWGWAICGVMFWAMAAIPLLGVLPILRGTAAVPGTGRREGRGGTAAPETEVLAGPGQPAHGATAAAGTAEERYRELAGIAADLGAAIGSVMAETPVDPAARAVATGDAGAVPEADFTEGTQALLDRLERLADMRDRDLLGPDEYETAKAAIMAELEERS
jgi:hypothetical protein